jgi:alpha-beta hydrolase superfamily lysophospholipase
MIRFTAARQDRTFVDEQGITVHFYQWKAAKPKGVVQISHGLGDHALRYEELAQQLVSAGYTVYADDHRGHGQTGFAQWGGDLSKLGRLGPGGLRATIDDVRELTRTARGENPELPLAIIGHSWGSLLAQIVVNRFPYDYDAVVLTGTAYRAFGHANAGDLNARHKHLGETGHEWLSRDPKVARLFLEDPLAFSAPAMKPLGLGNSLRMIGRPKRDLEKDLPLLIQIGQDDPFGGEKSAEKLAKAYLSRSGLTDVELIVYQDARHEVFNETNRDEVIADTIEWLDSRLHA